MLSLMFHSVGCNQYDWSRKHLSVSLDKFEYFCKYLKKKNYKTIWLDEWYSLQNISEKENSRYVVLTFDDGYLDNWVYVYPILKKYELKGTIFINPEFVDTKNNGKRPIYTQSQFNKKDQNNILGFLNWNEIIEMENSDTIDIQDHTLTHNKYFKGPEIIDFINSSNINKYDWVLWNDNPNLKPEYININLLDYLQEGTPVFENGRTLSVRKFSPDKKLISDFINKYKEYSFNANWAYSDIKNQLIKDYKKSQRSGVYPGKYETDKEMIERFRNEIGLSKKIIKKKLNKETKFLCWPGGGYNELSLKTAIDFGYIASTTGVKNDTLGLPHHKRLFRYSIGDKLHIKNNWIDLKLKSLLVLKFNAYRKIFIAKVILKLYSQLIKIKASF